MSADTPEGPGDRAPARRPQQRKQVLLRLDPLIHDALTRWAGDELRSANAQIEFLLRRALADAGRLPREAGPPARRGRPPKTPPTAPPAEHAERAEGTERTDGTDTD